MRVFRQLFLVATLAGLLSGAFITLVHQATTVPLILSAEALEQGAAYQVETTAGLARIAWTALADSLAAIGFALLLLAASVVCKARLDWRRGLLWGLAGFGVFFLAPSVGLPPALPGAEEAALRDRQVWWLLTVLATGGGVALLFFGRRGWFVGAGAALVVSPHLFGAPQLVDPASLAAPTLTRQFVLMGTLSNLLFWLVLGTLTGAFYARMQKASAR
jgi:cobalt transporter subunit CbtA